MTREEFFEGIALPEEARRAAEAAAPPEGEAAEWKALFLSDGERFARELRRREAPEALVLALYSDWALDARREYERLGIPEEVFFDSFRDFALWSAQCKRQKGRWGLIEWEWNALTLRLAIFRLGRLQYQPRTLDAPIASSAGELPAGTPVLEIHIPEGDSLRPEGIRASLSRAIPFFERFFSKRYEVFHCHSWLLAPELSELLPPQSNILAFQSLFDIYGTDYSFRQAEERVFGEISNDAASYPETTSLQRKLKAYLLSGGSIGMGIGVIRASGLEESGRV